MSHSAAGGSFGMSEEETTALRRDISEIKDKLKAIDNDLKFGFANLPCAEMGERVAKAEQRLDNGSQSAISSRAWVAIIGGWFFTLAGLAIALLIAYKK